jgi:hypothetical protein
MKVDGELFGKRKWSSGRVEGGQTGVMGVIMIKYIT